MKLSELAYKLRELDLLTKQVKELYEKPVTQGEFSLDSAEKAINSRKYYIQKAEEELQKLANEEI